MCCREWVQSIFTGVWFSLESLHRLYSWLLFPSLKRVDRTGRYKSEAHHDSSPAAALISISLEIIFCTERRLAVSRQHVISSKSVWQRATHTNTSDNSNVQATRSSSNKRGISNRHERQDNLIYVALNAFKCYYLCLWVSPALQQEAFPLME